MEDSSMAQDKDERPSATIKRTNEAIEDSTRRAPGTQGRPVPREAETAAEVAAAPPGRRRERYVLGSRTGPDGRPLGYPLPMEEVVGYLGRQENVEVIRRIKLGAEQPFTAAGRRANEVVVAKIDERK